jgi:beta-glucuronidase
MPKITYTVLVFVLFALKTHAQSDLITNTQGRKALSLNGKWQYIIDPYETGFYDYRYKELNEHNPDAYWNMDTSVNKSDRKEFGYTDKYSIEVPGDWNHQKPEFLYYEGTVWYKRSFNYKKAYASDRCFLYFGAVNYRADVYLNGKKLGTHKGGFTPFNFEVPASLLKERDNFLVVKADNKRGADEVPTLNTDWWNYGGITRDVKLIEVPETFIQDFMIQLKKSPGGALPGRQFNVAGWVKLNHQPTSRESIDIQIPELNYKGHFVTSDTITNISFKIQGLKLWSPDTPKLYKVIISSGTDRVEDLIGFRTIETDGKRLLLNGKPVFLRGICVHGEIAKEMRRAYSKDDAKLLLGEAKELGCNMVRLAHYPHDEYMTRMADSLGILVWSEIPVYWTVNFASAAVFHNAEEQLDEMITRDHNRASVIIWSVGNETPVSSVRTNFMHNLIIKAKQMDSTRLVSAALEVNYDPGKNMHLINDPLGAFVDIVAFNEYLGWYEGTPDQCRTAKWSTPYDKPLFISETGADAKGGFHADSLTRFTEEYQEWYFKEQVAMFKHMPENFVGLSPWVLADFRSPKRNNPLYQEGWNRKGLYDDMGKKKKAFYVLQKYYKQKSSVALAQ